MGPSISICLAPIAVAGPRVTSVFLSTTAGVVIEASSMLPTLVSPDTVHDSASGPILYMIVRAFLRDMSRKDTGPLIL